MSVALYELRNLSHSFSENGAALHELNLVISSGGCVNLIGCNGAGKSTLLHILAGLVTPRSGELLWQGQLLSSQILARDAELRNLFRRSTGIVFQDPDSQWLCDTVHDEVMYGPRQLWQPAEAEDRALQAMQVTGIEHLAEQAPYALSGGEKRRVALASIISMDPEVLLLDEPTSSLDAATIDFLTEWLLEFRSTAGKTLIVATHDLELVRELGGKCLMLTPCHKQATYDETSAVLDNHQLLRQMNLQSRRSRNVAS